MATLVLTAAGQVLGGPIGGAIGAAIGQQIDSRLFAPKARKGPRLGDLSVQTSNYGSPIPKLFGTMRVAGTVIWATDLKEERKKSGGGKGRPKTVEYSYSASFAVALSARPVRAVRRIWADGKLLRGAAGDFKTETGFRLHLGSEAQAVDPLIGSAEGEAPAYRGIAYAVFENFQLGDYGNRIPSLTFEVEADAGPVSAGEIAAGLSGGEIAGGMTPLLSGYAATGDSVRGAIEALGDLEALSLVDTGAGLRIETQAAATAATLRAAEIGARAGDAGGAAEWLLRSGDKVPGEATLTYYEPERDFQAGLQRATRGGAALLSDRRSVAAALDATTAKALAERRLASLWAERRTGKVHLGWNRLGLPAGATVAVEGQAGLWRISTWTLEHMVLTLELRGAAAPAQPAGASSPGRAAGSADQIPGSTVLELFELPFDPGGGGSAVRLYAAAAGTGAGWRRAALLASRDGGSSWEEAGATAPAAVIGVALDALSGGGSALLDRRNSVEVELANEAMWLEGRSVSALAGGANLALLGGELIQFERAEPLGNRRFRLSGLLRGRRGTEGLTDSHQTGERFVLIEAESLAEIEAGAASVGGEIRLLAAGLGDGTGVAVSAGVTGMAVRPPSPVHIWAKETPAGDIAIGWTRRSRQGWAWLSGSDTPLGEESEAYELRLSGAASERRVSVSEPSYTYTSAQQAQDGPTGPLHVQVVQLGTHLPSAPASITIE